MTNLPQSSHSAAPHIAAQRAEESLGNFARLFIRIPSGRRGAALRALLDFSQLPDWSIAYSLGELRAAFADWWEVRFEEAFPIRRLRDELATPLPVALALRFGRFNLVVDLPELVQCLAEFTQLLYEKTRPTERQLMLLDDEDTASEPETRPLGRTVGNLDELISAGEKFRTVYADPPWSYSNRASNGAAANHYATMTVDEICAHPINELTAEDAHLHLWTTNSFLREALQVIDAWGFRYKSCFVWVKPQMGMGNYWRVSHEFLCDRSHKNSYVVKFVMWRSHVERFEMPRRRTWVRHIIFASSGTIWTSFQSMQDKTAEADSRDAVFCRAVWENYVVHPARTVPCSEMNGRSPPHNQGQHIRIFISWREGTSDFCGSLAEKLVRSRESGA